MTPRFPRLLPLAAAAAALAAGCVPTQSAVRGAGSARGTEAWSWRMGATDSRWSQDRSQNAVRAELASRPAEDAASAAEPEPAAEDEAVMTLEPDPVGPRTKPKAVAAVPARTGKKGRVQPLPTSDSDEEFLDKILDQKADAEGGEITMAAVELPKAAPAKKKKKMTRAERRKALRLARLEKKKARELAAREARLRGKRARIDEEEGKRVATSRKTRSKKKGDFDENGEGFIDEDDDSDAEEDEVEREIASGYVDEDEDEDEEDKDAPPPAKKKAKPASAASTSSPSSSSSKAIARATPAKKVKTDWSGQALDDEDPLKPSKKK
jgi:hypothetical protein